MLTRSSRRIRCLLTEAIEIHRGSTSMNSPGNRATAQACYETSTSTMKHFFEYFAICKILNDSGIRKIKGCSAISIFFAYFMLPFLGQNIFTITTTCKEYFIIKKDSIYNFLNSHTFGWRNFLFNLSKKIIEYFNSVAKKTRDAKRNKHKPLLSKTRPKCLVLDDTCMYKERSKFLENYARKLWDHALQVHFKGYLIVMALFTDGISQIPVDFALTATSNKKNIDTTYEKKYHFNSNGYKRREDAKKSKIDVVKEMIQRLSKRKFKFDFVLMDSWYGVPILISYIYKFYHVICNIKLNGFKYKYKNDLLGVNEIYKKEKAKNQRKSMFSCLIQVENKSYLKGEKKYIDAKIVFLRKRDSKEYMAILSTNTNLCDKDIVRAYAYRWDIEVFFRTSKQFLRLDNGTQSCNFDALIASITIACTRYCFLSYVQRRDEDPMTHGALFQACCDELPEITFEQAIEQVLNITFKALAMASKSQENDARELVKQLESLVYSLKCNKLKKVFNCEVAKLGIPVGEPQPSVAA